MTSSILSNSTVSLRPLLEGNACHYPASVYDPISMRAAEQLGFPAAMLAGSVASHAVLGAPDLVILTLTELAGLVRRICRSGRLPLLVDADHGFGNELHVRRTIEELESAGAAGITIEDTDLPADMNAGHKGKLIPIEQGVRKMRAALSGRHDNELVVIGRTSALLITGLDDACHRLKAYEDAGVDALFIVGVKTWQELEVLRSRLTLPFILGGASESVMDPQRLAELGVRICLQGHQPFAASVAAAYTTLAALREGASPSSAAAALAPELMEQLLQASRYESIE